ncbi:hypothetical protein D3C84_605370 [compost metagenome]
MIVKVTVIGEFVVLVKLPLMFPLPLAPIPVTVPVLSLVQLKIVPATFPESAIVVIALVEHIVCVNGIATVLGVGLTVIVKVFVDPVQSMPPLFSIGVTIIVAITGETPLLVAVKEGILPFPDAAKPIEELLLVQEKVVVPLEFIVSKETADVGFASQTICEVG